LRRLVGEELRRLPGPKRGKIIFLLILAAAGDAREKCNYTTTTASLSSDIVFSILSKNNMLLKVPSKGGGKGGVRMASTLLLVRKRRAPPSSSGPLGGGEDYSLLLVQRSRNSTFMNSAHVFPGGCIESADRGGNWTEMFARIMPGLALSTSCHEHLYHRICGLRETFEETGILLGRQGARPEEEQKQGDRASMAHGSGEEVLDALRGAVTKSPREFYEQVWVKRGILPDVASMHLWDRWVTPLSENRRYDTFFYISVLEDPVEDSEEGQRSEHVARPDGKEISNLEWMSPTQALQASANKTIILPPPTVYVLTQLQKLFPTLAGMEKELAGRKREVVPKLPTLYKTLNENGEKPTGVIIALPGDELHEASVQQAEVSRLNGIGVQIARENASTEIPHVDHSALNRSMHREGVPSVDSSSVAAHRVQKKRGVWEVTFDSAAKTICKL
jgi:8-oxo-dGTP pyrophosphatase MutT (NUDIX family)